MSDNMLRMQDVRPKRNLRDVLPGKSAKNLPPPPPEVLSSLPGQTLPPRPRRASTRGGWWKLSLILIVLALVAGGVFAVSQALAKVTVVVTPKSFPLQVNQEIIATRETGSATSIPFELLTTESQTVSRDLTATGEEEVSRSASARIAIYNNFSPEPQRLVAQTRFESADGKLYRIREAVTVPGLRQGTPGSIEATIYADQPGADYNGPLTDFKLPGLKDTPRYDKVYARSKTPATGGQVGRVKIIASADGERARSELRDELRTKLLEAAQFALPEHYVLLPGAVVYSFEEAAPVALADNQVKWRETGRLEAVILDERILARLLAGNTLGEAGETNLAIAAPETLDAALKLTADTALADRQEIRLTLTGETIVRPIIDTGELATQIAGQKRSQVATIFAAAPTIERAAVTFRPPWLWRVPRSVDDIVIQVQP